MFRNQRYLVVFFLWECAIDNQHALACQASHSLSTIKLECLLECLSRLPSTLQSIVVQFVSRSGWTVGSCYECVCLPAYFVTVAVVAKFHPLSCSEGFNFKPQQRTSDHVFLCLVIFIWPRIPHKGYMAFLLWVAKQNILENTRFPRRLPY